MEPLSRKGYVAIGILCLINSLFLYKYGLRTLPAVGVLVGLVLVGQLLLFTPKLYARLLRRINPKYIATALTCAWLLFTALVHWKVSLEGLNVDRWSVIDSFLRALDAGAYPYFAESHLGNPPGPMPVYYLLAYPFNAFGTLELLSVIGPIAGCWWLATRVSHARYVNSFLLLLGSSAWVYWEVLVRSNLLTYSVLVVLALAYWVRLVKNYDGGRASIIGAAVVTGLLLSTRSVYALAYIPVFGSFLFVAGRRGVAVSSAVVAIATFVLTFLPFYLIWPDALFVMNPFIIQSGFLLPTAYVAVFLGLALTSLLLPRIRAQPIFSGGILLFAVILAYALYHVFERGLTTAYFDSVVDISYFIFCAPFLVYGTVCGCNDRRVN